MEVNKLITSYLQKENITTFTLPCAFTVQLFWVNLVHHKFEVLFLGTCNLFAFKKVPAFFIKVYSDA